MSFFVAMLASGTAFLLTLVAYIRWRAVVVESVISDRGVWYRIAGSWCGGLFFAILNMSLGLTKLNPSKIYCAGEIAFHSWQSFLYGILAFLILGILMIFIAYCYYKIYKKFQAINNRAVEARFVKGSAEKRLFRTSVVIVANFFIWMMPSYIKFAWGIIPGGAESIPAAFDAFTSICWILNGVSNPIIYVLFMRKYKREVKRMIGMDVEESSGSDPTREGRSETNATELTSV